MDMGTHEYGRAEVQRAKARHATIPTLDDLKAESDMVTMADGALVPASLVARGEQGWDGEQDRDSTQAARLAELVKDMDRFVKRWQDGTDSDAFSAAQLSALWTAIRAITQAGRS
jgi:hypothetical protein